MKTVYFKIIARKIGDKIALMAVVPEDFFDQEINGDIEMEAFKLPPNIYAKTDKYKGDSSDGIFTGFNWAIIEKEENDNLGIGL